jgi:hypothetical protein
MKFLLPAFAFFLAASSALAIEVSEEMLNTYVKQGQIVQLFFCKSRQKDSMGMWDQAFIVR